MTDADVFFAFAMSLIAVWVGLYVALVLWLRRKLVHAVCVRARRITAAVHMRRRSAIIDGVDAAMSLTWWIASAVAATPLVLIVLPLGLVVGGLELTAHLIHFRK